VNGTTVKRTRTPVRPGRVIFWTVAILIALAYLYPFVVSISGAFKTDAQATNDPLALIPNPWSIAGFQAIFSSWFPRALLNSVVVTVFVTLGRVFFNSLAGYALARLRFPGRTAVMAGILAVLSVPAVVLLIPRFLVVTNLGLFNTYAGMIIPLLADAAGIFIMRNFFLSIPQSVEEAALIDGAGPFRTFWQVVLPMATPALVTLTVLSFQGSWNELAHFIVSANNPDLAPLTRAVAAVIGGGMGRENRFPLQLAAATLMTIPPAVVFFIFQRRLMNASIGAVKE